MVGPLKTVAFIPLRGGSKSIPHKNIQPLAGKPLCCWVIEAAVDCSKIDRVFVSTDSHEIRTCVEKYFLNKVEVIARSPTTATDIASSELALEEFAGNHKFDVVAFIQATSPYLTAMDLDRALELFYGQEYDSLLSVVNQKRFLWEVHGGQATPINYDPLNRPRRQDFSGFLVENGAFYITSRESFLKSKCRLSGKIGICEMDESSYFEVDESHDWMIIEGILRNRSLPN